MTTTVTVRAHQKAYVYGVSPRDDGSEAQLLGTLEDSEQTFHAHGSQDILVTETSMED